MVFITGGIASGKRTFARSLGFTDDQMVCDAQELMRTETDTAVVADRLSAQPVVIAVEVGNGIVPLGADERAFRERAGRLSSALAARADVVVRMVCGIPTVLKGDPWS